MSWCNCRIFHASKEQERCSHDGNVPEDFWRHDPAWHGCHSFHFLRGYENLDRSWTRSVYWSVAFTPMQVKKAEQSKDDEHVYGTWRIKIWSNVCTPACVCWSQEEVLEKSPGRTQDEGPTAGRGADRRTDAAAGPACWGRGDRRTPTNDPYTVPIERVSVNCR